jgi:hypothetical protein
VFSASSATYAYASRTNITTIYDCNCSPSIEIIGVGMCNRTLSKKLLVYPLQRNHEVPKPAAILPPNEGFVLFFCPVRTLQKAADSVTQCVDLSPLTTRIQFYIVHMGTVYHNNETLRPDRSSPYEHCELRKSSNVELYPMTDMANQVNFR